MLFLAFEVCKVRILGIHCCIPNCSKTQWLRLTESTYFVHSSAICVGFSKVGARLYAASDAAAWLAAGASAFDTA